MYFDKYNALGLESSQCPKAHLHDIQVPPITNKNKQKDKKVFIRTSCLISILNYQIGRTE
jgi:hypothetical protein